MEGDHVTFGHCFFYIAKPDQIIHYLKKFREVGQLEKSFVSLALSELSDFAQLRKAGPFGKLREVGWVGKYWWCKELFQLSDFAELVNSKSWTCIFTLSNFLDYPTSRNRIVLCIAKPDQIIHFLKKLDSSKSWTVLKCASNFLNWPAFFEKWIIRSCFAISLALSEQPDFTKLSGPSGFAQFFQEMNNLNWLRHNIAKPVQITHLWKGWVCVFHCPTFLGNPSLTKLGDSIQFRNITHLTNGQKWVSVKWRTCKGGSSKTLYKGIAWRHSYVVTTLPCVLVRALKPWYVATYCEAESN